MSNRPSPHIHTVAFDAAAETHQHDVAGVIAPKRLTEHRPATFFWPLMMLWAIGVHYVWGTILIVAPNQASVAILGGLNPWLDLGVQPQQLGVLTILFATLALNAVVGEHEYSRNRLALLLSPQYVMLVVAMVSDVLILQAGAYRGRPIPRVTLIAVLWPLFLAQFLHTVSIIERLGYRWTPPTSRS